MRASKFFGKSEPGEDVCAFCAAQIKGELAKKDFIKDTFTDYGDLLSPGSHYICAGCAASLGDCVQPVRMIDGTQKTDKPGAGKALANRMFSWVCHGDTVLAATKAHVRQLRDFILCAPVGEECAVVLSDSGQKHHIFKAPVFIADGLHVVVRLEDETIRADVDALAYWLGVLDSITAEIGKPALLDTPSPMQVSALLDAGLSEDVILNWFQALQGTPFGRLAAWLARPKDGWK